MVLSQGSLVIPVFFLLGDWVHVLNSGGSTGPKVDDSVVVLLPPVQSDGGRGNWGPIIGADSVLGFK